MEIMDASAIRAVKKYQPEMDVSEGEAMLIFEVDGYRESTLREAAIIADICERCGGKTKIAKNSAEEERIWTTRRLVSVAISRLNPGKVAIYEAEDLGMPIKEVPLMLRKIRQISEKYDLEVVVFGHIGDGDIHTGIAIDLLDENEWKKVHAVKDEIYNAVLEVGGTSPASMASA